tara:strand:+ start:437 stop:994 length:558 start_codon:yes stop_codon:yes gene_type:complete
MSSPKEELLIKIKESVQEFAADEKFDKIKCLSRYDPDRVATILYLFSVGKSQTQIVKKYGFHRQTVIGILTDYADHLGKFKDLGGKLAARSYLQLSSLEEDLVEKVRDRLENDPEMEVTFRDLKELSIAKANASREALTARGEASQIKEERKVISQEDYEDTIKAARERIQALKTEDIIEVDGDN